VRDRLLEVLDGAEDDPVEAQAGRMNSSGDIALPGPDIPR
jgi:hypothetical protein